MEGLFSLLFVIDFIYLVIWVIKALIRSATNMPTWEGFIISAILGMLPFYLILCFFGIMGVYLIPKSRKISSLIYSTFGTLLPVSSSIVISSTR